MFKLIAWLVLGVVAGAIAKLIVPGRQGGGFWATAGLGILGAFLGGMIHNLINTKSLNIGAIIADKNVFDIGSILVAVLGSIVAIFLWGLVMGKAEN
jgi:uncharacterized membrane protein YeaQ/YmgE (transglycosylase-associated protein family)